MARHILLADDSTTIHRIVTDILTRENIRVTCVENGEEALRAILESTPDLVLADLTMPRMGGIELCELMKREKEFRNIPVIFLVSPFDDYNEAQAGRVGGAGHLVKPFDSYRLMTLVKKYLPAEAPVAAAVDDQEVATIEQIDDADDESDAMSTQALQTSFAPRSDFAELADLPEPMGLPTGMEPVLTLEEAASLSSLSSLNSIELSLTDRAIESETVELDASHLGSLGTEILGDASPLDEDRLIDEAREVIRGQLQSMGGASMIDRLLREVIREEVRRVIPHVIETVVRERVRELEREVEARSRPAGSNSSS